jgi:hypothetical protein
MVSAYRHQLENLYLMAHLQGAIDQVQADRAALRIKAAA